MDMRGLAASRSVAGKLVEPVLAATGQLVQYILGLYGWSCYLQMCACISMRSLFYASLRLYT